ncbi:MAG TPA: leucine-rich repeat protein, partial [Caproiciproducens sp.]|nr:leucine-rich repeat protein [Caproiciproducens sp.]
MKKVFQKFLSIALAVSMVVAMMPKLAAYAESMNWKDSTDESWYTESASSYKIGTAQQLADFAKRVNGGTTFAGKTVTLTADIDLAGRDWTPIGTDAGNRFQGTFDGRAHVISHLTIGSSDNPNSDLLYLGLFGYLSQTDGAEVRQVGIENAEIYSSHENADAGGLAGLVANTSSKSKELHLEKTYVTGGIYASGSGSCAGGSVGKISISYNHGYFYYKNSYASCDVSAQLYAGGLIGYSAPCGANYTALMCNRDKEQTVAGHEVAAASRKLFGFDGSFGGALDKTHCITASEMKTDTFLCNSSMSSTNFGSINLTIYYNQIGFGLREGKNDGLPILKMLLRPLNVGDPFTGDDGYFYTAISVGDKKEAKFTGAMNISGVFAVPSVTSYDDEPYHVTAVGNKALYGQTALTGLTISSGVTAIGDQAFYNCTNLESVSIADSVKSIGEQAFYNCGIKELQLGNGISQLGNWAFFGCKNLKSAVLPDSLTTCGSSIFRECAALTSVNIPSGLTAINTEMLMGTSIESITLPESITSVGMYALSSCPKLKSITFLGNLQKIDQDAFSNDPLLKTIVFKSAVPPTTINSGGIFFGDAHPIYGQVPSGSVQAYQSAFSSAYCFPYYIKFGDQPLQLCVGETFSAQNSGTVITYKVTSVSPATVEVAAGSPAYSGPVIIPEFVKGSDGYTYQVTGIGSGAFSGCEGLTSAVLPSGVAAVGNQAFSDCAALTELTFEGEVPKTVGTDVFTGDHSITCVVPPASLESYNTAFSSYVTGGQVSVKSGTYADAFKFTEKNENGVSIQYQVLSAENKTVEVIANSPSYSGEVMIPSSVIGEDGNAYTVTEIGQKAFWGCSNLTGVTMPESIASIDDWAFEDCSKLTNVSIPANVTQIGNYAFKGCKGLTKIQLPANLDSLGVCSFMNCSGLTNVTIPDKITEISQQAFDG